MMKIAVCDDEKYFRVILKKIISDYLTRNGVPFEIDMFSSGEEIVELGIELNKYSVIFLDIRMKAMNGIITAQKIREFSNEIFIVFVTAYEEFALEGYKVDAVRYLLKDSPDIGALVDECLYTIINKMNYVVIKKKFKFNECEKEILLNRLLFIESRLHKLEFHVMEKEMKVYTLYGTLNEMETELKEYDFLRIHQSYLVNLKHIKKIECYHVTLSNNEKLIIPKVRYKKVKKEFICYRER